MAVDYRKSSVLMQVGGIVGVLLMLSSSIFASPLPSVAGIVIGLAAIIQAWIFYRCPHCGGHWDIRVRIPHYCPTAESLSGREVRGHEVPCLRRRNGSGTPVFGR